MLAPAYPKPKRFRKHVLLLVLIQIESICPTLARGFQVRTSHSDFLRLLCFKKALSYMVVLTQALIDSDPGLLFVFIEILYGGPASVWIFCYAQWVSIFQSVDEAEITVPYRD